MLTIRLQRVGRRNDPAHRIVVQDSRQSPKSGRVVEILGSYNPKGEGATVDAEKASLWIQNGAKVSGTVHNILVDEGVIKDKKINVLPHKKPVVKEEEEKTKAEEKPTEKSETESESGESAAEESEEKTTPVEAKKEDEKKEPADKKTEETKAGDKEDNGGKQEKPDEVSEKGEES